ncbi:MAG: CDP-glycerol glycerophosphotransferase family protein [Clostridiales bacterium]|nr:CDP-glycerol glycerophosphotransferase family protein [Clostridiales bacterium]
MVRLYIDPGTGSMLFTVFIGIISAAVYVARAVIIKIKNSVGAGKKIQADKNKIPIVIFSDHKRYFTTFKPICDELDKKGIRTVYMTMSPDDPALETHYENITAEFIGSGNDAFARMNLLNARIVLSTTPSIDVFQWKRSKDVDWYVHVLHSAGDVTMYRLFGIDYYDAILTSGKFQEDEVRALEKMRNLPAKELYRAGIPYMDEMLKRAKTYERKQGDVPTVLLAPTWGEYGLLNRYGEELIRSLVDTGYNIVIRPHPQSFTADKDIIDGLMSKFPESDKLHWNRDNDNFEALADSDIMISDFSAVNFDYAFVFDKPLIYSNTGFTKNLYDAWRFEEDPWNVATPRRIGIELTKENIPNLKQIIDDSIGNTSLDEARNEAKNETWCNIGSSAAVIADYLADKYEELGRKDIPEEAEKKTEAAAEVSV